MTLLLGFSLQACKEPPEHLPCEIELLETELDFGDVPLNERSILELRVRNTGSVVCLLGKAELHSEADVFFVFPWQRRMLMPGQTQTLVVDYTPMDLADHSGEVTFSASSGDYRVGLSGRSRGGTLAASAYEVNFDATEVGCSRSSTVTLYNQGNAPLTIDYLLFYPDGLELNFEADAGGSQGQLPWTLPVAGERSVSFSYAPLDLNKDSGVLFILSDDVVSDETVLLVKGGAQLNYEQIDSFEQPESEMVSFELSAIPAPDTLQVQVAGVHTNAWAYEASSNTVVFMERYVPEAGSEVKIRYAAPGDCL
jgi:hypothetical protein